MKSRSMKWNGSQFDTPAENGMSTHRSGPAFNAGRPARITVWAKLQEFRRLFAQRGATVASSAAQVQTEKITNGPSPDRYEAIEYLQRAIKPAATGQQADPARAVLGPSSDASPRVTLLRRCILMTRCARLRCHSGDTFNSTASYYSSLLLRPLLVTMLGCAIAAGAVAEGDDWEHYIPKYVDHGGKAIGRELLDPMLASGWPAIQGALRNLQDPDPPIRVTAAAVFSFAGDSLFEKLSPEQRKGIVRELGRQVTDDDPSVQDNLISALSHLLPEAEAALPSLISVLCNSKSERVLGSAADVIIKIHLQSASVDNLAKCFSNNIEYPARVFSRSPDSLPQLLDLVAAKPTAFTIRGVISSFRQANDPRQKALAQTFLEYQDPLVRWEATYAFGESLADENRTDAVKEDEFRKFSDRLLDEDQGVRSLAQSLLTGSALRGRLPTNVLTRSLDNPSNLGPVMEVLVARGEAMSAVPRVLEILETESDPQTRFVAAAYLGIEGAQYRYPELLPALKRILFNSEPPVRSAAAMALLLLGNADEPVIKALRDDLTNPDRSRWAEDYTEDAIAKALGNLGAPALPTLELLLSSDDDKLKLAGLGGFAEAGVAAKAYLPLLLRFAHDDRYDYRALSAIARILQDAAVKDESVDTVPFRKMSPGKNVRSDSSLADAYRAIDVAIQTIDRKRSNSAHDWLPFLGAASASFLVLLNTVIFICSRWSPAAWRIAADDGWGTFVLRVPMLVFRNFWFAQL